MDDDWRERHYASDGACWCLCEVDWLGTRVPLASLSFAFSAYEEISKSLTPISHCSTMHIINDLKHITSSARFTSSQAPLFFFLSSICSILSSGISSWFSGQPVENIIAHIPLHRNFLPTRRRLRHRATRRELLPELLGDFLQIETKMLESADLGDKFPLVALHTFDVDFRRGPLLRLAGLGRLRLRRLLLRVLSPLASARRRRGWRDSGRGLLPSIVGHGGLGGVFGASRRISWSCRRIHSTVGQACQCQVTEGEMRDRVQDIVPTSGGSVQTPQ